MKGCPVFRTVIAKGQRSRPTASVSGGWAADRHDLLAAARGGDVCAVGQLCDRHGGALYGLACVVLSDSARAESVVVAVLARACADPRATGAVGGGSLRRDLARLTYLYSIRCLGDTDRPVLGSATARMAELSELARQQRSAIALVQCGDHTVGDVADLLGLPVPAVAVLLTSGLRDLEAADRRVADDRLQHTLRTGQPA